MDQLINKLNINKLNPDWQIENFWLSFKNQFYNLLSDNEKHKINNMSTHLNELQRKKKYDQIQQYIVNNFDSIAMKVILSKDIIINRNILPYFNKWNEISPYKFDKTNINYQLLKANDIINNKTNISEKDKLFQELIFEYVESIDNKNIDVVFVLDKMVKHCIKYQQWNNLERIRHNIDIKKYLNDKVPEKFLLLIDEIGINKLKDYFIS